MESNIQNIVGYVNSFKEQVLLADRQKIFPDDFIIQEIEQNVQSSIEFDNEKSQNRDTFHQYRENTLIKIYKEFNYSLLSGEYISNSEIENSISNIIKITSEVLNVSDFFSNTFQVLISEFTTSINLACSIYKTFIKIIKNEYSEDRIEHLFSYSGQINKDFVNDSIPDQYKKLWLYFKENINLALLDHFFSSENKQFIKLFNIEKALDNINLLEFNNLTKVIRLKINFLEHKWKIRKQENNPSEIHYIDDGELARLEDFSTTNDKLKEWISLITRHYQIYISNWKFEIEKNVKPFLNEEPKKLNYIQFHQLIKYYKDAKINFNKLSNISKILQDNIRGGKNFYDEYAFKTISNYALNNKFSLFLEQCNDLDKIRIEFQETRDKTLGENHNFFIEYKYLGKLINLISEKSQQLDNLSFLNDYEELISVECKKILDDYFYNKEWSKNKNNYIFVLPFEESIVKIEEFKIKQLPYIFIASSFVLPKENNLIDNQYYEIKQKFKGLLFQIDSLKRLKKDLQEVSDVRKEMDKRDIKSIEIISIFTAIITFVLSSIPAYKFIDNVWESLLFMISLSSSLGFFILLIIFTTRGFKKNWIGWVYAILLILISTAGYFILTGIEKRESTLSKETIKQIDSISTKKIDSILKSLEKK